MVSARLADDRPDDGRQHDADPFRAFTEAIGCLAPTQEVLRPAGRAGSLEPAPSAPGPDRQQLLALIAGPA